ncbi:hypothetical protein [Endozoicomonas acroporae]|uniref:hypothetical protein n=3 Tax=Endozoicomonas TaxID=305899 RepID=UPI003D7A4F04
MNFRQKMYESLSKMAFDLVKLPAAILLLQPILANAYDPSVMFFGFVLCMASIYAGIVFDFKYSEESTDV